MSIGLFLDLDGVLTPKAVNLQYAAMLGVEPDLLALEDNYANGLIDNSQFNKVFIPLFRAKGFTLKFAQDNFRKIVFSPYAEELILLNFPDTFIVSSSPSYFLDQFATKYKIPPENVICSRYAFDDDGLLASCDSPAGVLEKAEFVSQRINRFSVSVGVGDSPDQDAKFMNHCSLKILMGGERRNYLHAIDLPAVHSLVQLVRSQQVTATNIPPYCVKGVDQLQRQGALDKNVFIITPFRQDARYEAAVGTIKDELKKGGYRGWTAADMHLDDDLWINVQCFMYGCKGAIALLTADEKQTGDTVKVRRDVYNPNVIAEAGYMLGQG